MIGIQSHRGVKVRDMVRRYDTASNCGSVKHSFSSIGASKSSYFGLNAIPDDDLEDLYAEEEGATSLRERSPGSPSRSSNGSQKTVRKSGSSPTYEAFSDIDDIPPLDTQKSFMNLSSSRTKKPSRQTLRNNQANYSSFPVEPQQQNRDPKLNIPDASYHSKTTISKIPNGVRIIVDIFFDQNKNLAVEDVVGSRIETDIPPSKILKEFQKRVAADSMKDR